MSDTTPVSQAGSDSRRHRAEGTSWIVGVMLILLGSAFMAERAGLFVMVGNWWAIFIYLAAFASFSNVWRSYRARERFGSAASGSLIWGVALTVVASIFMFDLSWDMWWPAVVIAVGVGMVASTWIGNATRKS